MENSVGLESASDRLGNQDVLRSSLVAPSMKKFIDLEAASTLSNHRDGLRSPLSLQLSKHHRRVKVSKYHRKSFKSKVALALLGLAAVTLGLACLTGGFESPTSGHRRLLGIQKIFFSGTGSERDLSSELGLDFKGAVVSKVHKGSQAAEKNVEVGWVVLFVGGDQVKKNAQKLITKRYTKSKKSGYLIYMITFRDLRTTDEPVVPLGYWWLVPIDGFKPGDRITAIREKGSPPKPRIKNHTRGKIKEVFGGGTYEVKWDNGKYQLEKGKELQLDLLHPDQPSFTRPEARQPVPALTRREPWREPRPEIVEAKANEPISSSILDLVEENEYCPICLEEFESKVYPYVCGHPVCWNCYQKWKDMEGTYVPGSGGPPGTLSGGCPTCRCPRLKSEDKIEEKQESSGAAQANDVRRLAETSPNAEDCHPGAAQPPPSLSWSTLIMIASAVCPALLCCYLFIKKRKQPAEAGLDLHVGPEDLC